MTTAPQDSTVYKAAFFIVPARILDLPNITLAFLKVYETIFQFWNHGQKCFLSDQKIMERTGLSERSVRDAFIFFEECKELKREKRGARRYLIQPTLFVETNPVDNSASSCIKSVTHGTPLPHNKNKLNNKNLNKSSYAAHEKKYETKAERIEAKNEIKQMAKFWEPGNPDYDRLHPSKKGTP